MVFSIKKAIYIFGVFFCSFMLPLAAFSEDCTYQFDLKNSSIQGTGYKFTKKMGVSGYFPDFKLSKNGKKKSVMELLKGLVVTVNPATLDSGNPVRDKNMTETLFFGLAGGSEVTVSVENVTDTNIETQLKINNRTRKVIFTYSIKEGVLTARGRFNAFEYALGRHIEALKKRCGPLHTGQNGKSVTWTDFDLSGTAKIIKTCQKKN